MGAKSGELRVESAPAIGGGGESALRAPAAVPACAPGTRLAGGDARKRSRLFARVLVKTAAISLVLAILGLPLAFVMSNTMAIHRSPPRSPAASGLAFEDVSFATSDGLTIKGWWVPSPSAKRTFLLCHGVHGIRSDMIKYMPLLHEAGYNLLAFDWRGHGLSDGTRITYGLEEVRDLEGALAWVGRTHPESASWIGALGSSLGAGILLESAGKCPQIQAFVLDSPWASLRTMLPYRLAGRGVPAALNGVAGALVSLWMRVLAGAWIDQMAPIDHIRELAGRPVFLVHGTADGVIPVEESRLICAALPQPHDCWFIEGGHHVQALDQHPSEYKSRLLAFLARTR